MKVTSGFGSWLYLSNVDTGNCTKTKFKQDSQVIQVLKIKLMFQAGNIQKGQFLTVLLPF